MSNGTPETKNYVKKDESVFEAKRPGMGHEFPWVAVIFPNSEDEFTLSFRTCEDACKAIEIWTDDRRDSNRDD